MRADQLSGMARRGRVLAASVVLAVLAASAAATDASAATASAASDASATPAPRLKPVSYLGYTFKVPRSWPVINNADHPRTCVRFDHHAVYLGVPGLNQDCPSWLFGTTEALLIQPGPAHAAIRSTENPIARQVTVAAPRISLSATFDANPTMIYRILASAALPAPAIKEPKPAQLASYGMPSASAAGQRADAPLLAARARALGAGTSAQRAGQRALNAAAAARRPLRIGPALPAQVTDFHGRGFDACAAPSRGYMRAWRRRSPYRAVGIYIGGADRACDQRNLTPGWVRREARAGWHFIPMYAGPQAAFNEIRSAVRQARRAAADAVAQAERLGFGPRTPLYYDMEAYPARDTRRALRFLSAWTAGLHALGYLSGVYSSSQSGIMDLARHYTRDAYIMPDVVYDALWNGSPNTADRVYRSGEWSNHQRLHQYNGNITQTYGHAAINIDQDYLNVQLPGPVTGGTSQASPAVSGSGRAAAAFFQGAKHRLWRAVRSAGARSGRGGSARAGWARPVDMGGPDGSVPSAVSVGSGALDVFYRGTGGHLWEVSFRSGRGWRPARRLAMMGILGSAPRAVARAGGVVDVFWKGSADRHLWYSQFSPRRGWKGPRSLGGRLASAPSPVESSPGILQVFWKGADRSLWHVTRRLTGRWTRPDSLGMGPLVGAPHATAQVSGTIEVFWRGSGHDQVWAAFRSSHGWRGPRDLGWRVTGAPWPATAAGRLRLLWRGPGGRLWETHRAPSGRWRRPVRLRVGRTQSAPFTASGAASGMLDVFWQGRGGQLWWAAMAPSGTWTRARSVGGRMA